VLYVASYLVKDILWLRFITIVAGFVLLASYVLRPAPDWPAVYWNLLFSAINGYQIVLLLLERKPVLLTADEQEVYKLAFRSLTLREFAKLMKLAQWEAAPTGTHIVESGKAPDRMLVIVDGEAAVEVGGRAVARLRSGQFAGEMSFLTGKAPNADVVAVAPTRYVSWKQTELKTALERSADLRAAWQMVIGTDLVGKLQVA
jgi:hypothetical protein